ncbi:MAG TPA: hypothetical protein GXX18_06125 [Bacillales bacterium]|nr:hypothetical protein [Bacillales bacterium]
MFNYNHYVPALKWKRGERVALKNLTPKELDNITPLIEIQPIPYNHKEQVFKKTIEQHLDNTGANLLEIWSSKRPIFIDGHTLFDDTRIDPEILLNNGQSPLEFIIDDIESFGISAIPVTSLLRYESYHESVQFCVEKYKRGVCLRLFKSDLSDINHLNQNIDNILQYLKVNIEDVDIIIDYRQIDPDEKYQIINELILSIAKFPYLKRWRTFTFLSTSMTKNLSHIPTNTTNELAREEWNIYLELLKQGISRFPSFGDYNISHPDWFDFDSTKYDRGANLKYTVDSKYIIFRGRGVKKYGFNQMQQLCQNVILHKEYCSKTFSFGDEYIYNCANGTESTGNSETWVRVNVNHHLAFIINCLTNSHATLTV